MKNYILLILFCLFFIGCAPNHESPIPKEILTQLESDEGIQSWKDAQMCTDGCSSPFPINLLAYVLVDKNWGDCCIQHDFDYKKGYLYGITKEMADYALYECVKASNHHIIANIIYDGVVVFGSKYYQTKDYQTKEKTNKIKQTILENQ